VSFSVCQRSISSRNRRMSFNRLRTMSYNVTVHGFGGCSVRCVEDHGACGKREGATPPRRKA
jgi:hypothetical protein